MMRTILFALVLASTTPAMAAETTVYVRARSEYMTDFVQSKEDSREQSRFKLGALRAERARRFISAIDEQRLFRTSLQLTVNTAGTPVASR